MKFNLFEGARRIALALATLAVAMTCIALYSNSPSVHAHYVIDRPGGPPIPFSECPRESDSQSFSRTLRSGQSVWVTICHLPFRGDDGKSLLYPFKVDDRGALWGAGSQSEEFISYKRILAAQFVLSAEAETDLVAKHREAYRSQWLSGLSYLGIGLAVFAGFVNLIGWIVRGFLSIPRGMDHRPV